MSAIIEPDVSPLTVYLDASAAVKLIVDEAERDALRAFLERQVIPVSSDLLETELRRTANRVGIDQHHVTEVLDRINLTPIDRSLFRGAGLLPHPTLRSLDALHLAAALEVDAHAVVTYDERMAEAARALGLAVITPGAAD
ncbi:MAG TPA: type II toxin-antitoxin system VapC family toxin [Microbacteriaceae bacterium]|nr:type II toxin-antitoxin system VapC family toxin [Microbacteriaceae bacterium]